MHYFIWAYIIFMNLLGLLTMFIDKRRAVQHKWRISEAHLLIIPILGGGFGTWIGIYLFRHKTTKIKFNLGVPIIIFIQVACIIYLIR